MNILAYFPNETWYNYKNGSVVPFKSTWVNLPASLDTINVHQRGGTIIPTQHDALTTSAAQQLPFSLHVALNSKGEATGSLFWDDGENVGEKRCCFILLDWK